MLETPHVVVGAVIATKVVNPALALPLAFLSHFVLEKVPHWNPHLNSEKKVLGRVSKKSTIITAIDSSLALGLGLFIASRALPNIHHALTITLAGFMAVLPDVIEGPYFFLNYNSTFMQKWIKFQKSLQADAKIIPGLFTQLTTIAVSLWWIFS